MAAANGGDPDGAASAGGFQAFEKLTRRIDTLRVGAGGTAVVVGLIFAVMSLSDDSVRFVSEGSAGWVIVVACMVTFAAVSTWPVIWSVGVTRLFRAILFADGLQPFHDLREAIASGRLIARRPDGGIHSAPLFQSPWALTAFSRSEDVRHMRLPGSRKGVADEPLIDLNDRDEPIAELKERSEVAASLDRVTDRLESVEIAVAEASKVKAIPPRPVKLHWYASVTETTHLKRSADIANRWSGPAQEQVTHALNKAFLLTREDYYPCISATDLATKVAGSLKVAGLPIGLGDTDSKVWLEKMFGSGSRNDYAYVRRYLTEPDYKLPYELPLSR